MGGFINSSVVIIWSLICPIGALVFSDERRSLLWFAAYAGLVILSGFLQSTASEIDGSLGDATITIFFVANIVTVPTLVFPMLYYFMNQLHQEQIRIGINSGLIVGGVIGQTKFHYDVWGDALNVASRMVSHGVPGNIQIAEATHALFRQLRLSLPGHRGS